MVLFLRSVAYWLVVAIAVVAPIENAQAYVGPGLGLGTLAVVVGVIGSVLLAVFAIVWYPLKRMLTKRKPRTKTKTQQNDTSATAPEGQQPTDYNIPCTGSSQHWLE